MKVSKEAPYQLIFSIKHHPQLGPVIEPFVVELTSIQTLSLTFQKVFSGNAEYYDRLSREELELISMLDPLALARRRTVEYLSATLVRACVLSRSPQHDR